MRDQEVIAVIRVRYILRAGDVLCAPSLYLKRDFNLCFMTRPLISFHLSTNKPDPADTYKLTHMFHKLMFNENAAASYIHPSTGLLVYPYPTLPRAFCSHLRAVGTLFTLTFRTPEPLCNNNTGKRN